MKNDQNIFSDLILERNFSDYQTDPSGFEKILQKNLPAIRKTHPEIYFKVMDFYNWIIDYAAYRENLINKNITVLAGRKSSGKTAFFNTVFGNQILPEGLPGNIPVYCTCKDHKETKALTAFERLVAMDSEMFFQFFSEKEENGNEQTHIAEKLFKSIMTFSEHTGLRHITFLDLGGYQKPSDKSFSDAMNPDRITARINRCSSLIWFADIDPNSLSISDDDIEILKMIKPEIPKIIVISKADIYPQAAFNEIFEKTKKILFARKIKNLDVLTYSSTQPEKFDKYKILAYLDRWDHKTEQIPFTEIFSSLFSYSEDETACGKNLSDILPELEAFRDRLYQVPNAFQSGSENQGFIPVDSLQGDSSSKTKTSARTDDLSRNKSGSILTTNPEKLFRNYNSAEVKDMTSYERYVDSVSTIILENLRNITPVLSENKNSSEYKKDLMGIISEYFHVISVHKPDISEENSAERNDDANDGSDRSSSRRSRRSRTDNDQQKSGSLFRRDRNK